MDPRPFLLLTPMASMLLAGCASDGADTAQEGEDIARRQTTAQAENLLAVLTTESSAGLDGFGKDGSIDGRATAWYYAYRTNGPPAIVRVEGHEAQMVAAIPGPLGQLELPSEPLGKLHVDSDAAVRAARSDADFDTLLSTHDAVLHEAAGNVFGARIWLLVAHAAGRSAFATVDADTGALLRVDVKDGTTPDQLFPDSGHHAGPLHVSGNATLTAAVPVQEFFFDAATGATVELDVTKDFPLDELEWAVIDGAGKTVHSGRLAELATASDYASVDLDLEGEAYTLLLRLATPDRNVPPQGPLDVGVVIIPA